MAAMQRAPEETGNPTSFMFLQEESGGFHGVWHGMQEGRGFYPVPWGLCFYPNWDEANPDLTWESP